VQQGFNSVRLPFGYWFFSNADFSDFTTSDWIQSIETDHAQSVGSLSVSQAGPDPDVSKSSCPAVSQSHTPVPIDKSAGGFYWMRRLRIRHEKCAEQLGKGAGFMIAWVKIHVFLSEPGPQGPGAYWQVSWRDTRLLCQVCASRSENCQLSSAAGPVTVLLACQAHAQSRLR
jgi:hypothetical protein